MARGRRVRRRRDAKRRRWPIANWACATAELTHLLVAPHVGFVQEIDEAPLRSVIVCECALANDLKVAVRLVARLQAPLVDVRRAAAAETPAQLALAAACRRRRGPAKSTTLSVRRCSAKCAMHAVCAHVQTCAQSPARHPTRLRASTARTTTHVAAAHARRRCTHIAGEDHGI